jgi:uncharacterized OB-fold protein
MPVLKADSKRVGYKLVGVTVRGRVHTYLSLYTIAKGITKTSIFKELIIGWVDELKKEESDMNLVGQIIKRVQAQWNVEKNRGMSLAEYKTELAQELLTKGITEEHIEMILKDVR